MDKEQQSVVSGKSDSAPTKGERSKVRSTVITGVSVASGYSLLKRLSKSVSNVGDGAGKIRDLVIQDEIDEDAKRRLDGIHDGSEDGSSGPARYAIFNPRRGNHGTIYYHDDYAQCMKIAFSQDELAVMLANTRQARRLQTYGATIVAALSIFFAFKLTAIYPLLSIFPAVTMLTYSARRACTEITIETLSPCNLQRLINERGIKFLWS